MDIHIEQISRAATISDVKKAIAQALRSSPIAQGGSLIPFEVTVDSRGRAGQYCRGLLTLPTHDIGQRFLREFGGAKPRRSVTTARTTLVFFEQQRPVLRAFSPTRQTAQQPADADVLREKRRLLESIQRCRIPVLSIQFGWECRDSIYSIEWERYFVGKPCHLSFSPYRQEFTIKMSDDAYNNLIIVIKAAQISWAAPTHISTAKSAFFLSLRYPPSYEQEPAHSHAVTGTEQKPSLRRQLQFIDELHARCVPWASLALRVECEGMQLPSLTWLCNHAQVQCRDFEYPVDYRGLFSPRVQKQYNSWVKSLPWEVAFQVEAITRDRLTDLKEMWLLRSDMLGMSEKEGPAFTAALLQQFSCELRQAAEDRALSPGLVDDVREIYLRCRRRFQPPVVQPGEQDTRMDNFLCLHVMVSPTTQRLQGPLPERTNRIVRQYWEYRNNFILVSFVDDAQLPVQYRFDPQVDTLRFIRERYGEVLQRGVTVAERHFEYLHYSMSGLRQHTFWFLRPFDAISETGEIKTVTAETILRDIGEIPEDSALVYCPALLGARLAQAFTATDAAVTVEAEEIFLVPDEMDASGTRSFTDGVGTISPALLQDIWDELLRSGFYKRYRGLECPPAIQFRFSGAKGVLTKDHSLTGRAVCLRPSQTKFQAPHSRQIEVVSVFYKPGKFALNRTLIMIFEGLGIRGGYAILKSLQDAIVDETSAAKQSLESASKLLERYSLGTSYRLASLLRKLDHLHIGTRQLNEFHQYLIHFIVHHVLRDLKYHARIPAPGYTLLGVADVHKYLPEGRIFAYVVPIDGSEPVYLEGTVMIFRSPTKHPGDIQIVQAIGKPPPGSPFEREPLKNTVVFSVLGSRPLASCLSGGDLDGDTYVCTTFEPLLPARPHLPAEYQTATRKTLSKPSTKADMIEFVVEFLYSNNIGLISNQWLLHADQQKDGVLSKQCLLLAELHSAAVDYPKTGIPVPLHRIPKHRRQKPDWSKPEVSSGDASEYYESQRWLGKLYRAIEVPALPPSEQYNSQQTDEEFVLQDILHSVTSRLSSPQGTLEEVVKQQISQFIEVDCHDLALLEEVCGMYDDYRTRLSAIRHTFTLSPGRAHNSPSVTPLTEPEIMLGTISAPCAQNHRRKELISGMRGQTDHLCLRVREGLAGSANSDSDSADEDMLLKCKTSLRRAWTAYGVSLIDKSKNVGAESFNCLALVEIFDNIDRINGYMAVVEGHDQPQ